MKKKKRERAEATLLAVRTLPESAPAARRGTATSHLKECLGRGGEGRGRVLLYVVPSDISKARCCGGDEMEKKQKKRLALHSRDVRD